MNTQIQGRSVGNKWTDTITGHNWKQLQIANKECFVTKLPGACEKVLTCINAMTLLKGRISPLQSAY